MNTKILEELGLTKNEIKIYLALLKLGQTTTGKIIKQTKISNSRVYESINTLIDKGLITYTVQHNGKHFQATPPKTILENYNEKKKKILSLIPELEQLKNLSEIEPKTAVFEGFSGFKTAFKKIIDDCPKNKEIFILGFSEQEYATKSLRIFLKNMNRKSSTKKQKLKILLDSSVKKTLGKDRQKEKYTEVKYMPKGYISPSAMDIFEDYVYIFLWEEKPFVFMIKNQRIADSFKQYFNFLWKIAKK